jgi:hypothetical protein
VSRIKNLASQFEQKADATVESTKRIEQGQARTVAQSKRLMTNLLEAAGFPTTKNPLLSQIWGEVEHYNKHWTHPTTLSAAAVQERVAQLDNIMYWSGQYMTSKWAKDPTAAPDAKRVKRWDALKDLLPKAVAELQVLGVRCLVGPTDYKQISNSKRSYWLERVDPQHRPGWVLSAVYGDWLTQRPTDLGGNPIDFFAWLATTDGQSALVNRNVASDANKNVQYDSTGEPLWAQSVYFETGMLKSTSNDSFFMTRNRRTEFSSNGWAIWVCSSALMPTSQTPTRYTSRNHVFSYSHEAGIFHHSTFLSGHPVLAAGEWIVDNGTVKVITAKSGHYTPKPSELLRFVTTFKDIPRDAIIRPDLTDRTQGAQKVLFYRVGDFVANYLGARPITRSQFRAIVPTWANTYIIEQHAKAATGSSPPVLEKTLMDLLPT